MGQPDDPPPSADPGHAALDRVVRRAGGKQFLDLLSDGLPGADLTTLLLEASRRRASAQSPADVLRRYRSDRFCAPGAIDLFRLRRAEDAMLAALPAEFAALTLAPVLPLGTHWATGGVDPRNVIATIRRSEVAADPTNGLALEAAVRRRGLLDASPRSAEPVRLATSQRVTRGQRFDGPASFAHFQLFGMVTAGRDTGDLAFERQHLAEHLATAVRGLRRLECGQVRIGLTGLDERFARITAVIRDEFAGQGDVEIADAPERCSGRAYYRGVCFKVHVRPDGGDLLEVGDGGFTDWTARLLGDRKERLLISGYGVDRIAITAL